MTEKIKCPKCNKNISKTNWAKHTKTTKHKLYTKLMEKGK